MIRYLYNLQNDHVDKLSTHFTPYTVIKIISTIFPMLYLHPYDCFLIFFTYFYCSSTVVSIFPLPLPPTPAIPTSHPWFYHPLILSMCPLYMFVKTLLPFPPISLSHLPSGDCQFVLNFNVSGYILLACLFVDYVPWLFL